MGGLSRARINGVLLYTCTTVMARGCCARVERSTPFGGQTRFRRKHITLAADGPSAAARAARPIQSRRGDGFLAHIHTRASSNFGPEKLN